MSLNSDAKGRPMKKSVIIFLMSSVQFLCAMEFPITAEIKKNMKTLHEYTLYPTDSRPGVENCKASNRILIAREDRVFCRYRYLRFETDEQVDQLVNQIPEKATMQSGTVWKIEWFYYDSVEKVTPPSTGVASSFIADDDQLEPRISIFSEGERRTLNDIMQLNVKLCIKNEAERRFRSYIRDHQDIESLCASDDNPYLPSYEDEKVQE